MLPTRFTCPRRVSPVDWRMEKPLWVSPAVMVGDRADTDGRFARTLGCRFAIDDFGTGFSSFTHLRHLPVDFVKIEGSFVEGMAGSELDRKMVSSITQLAQSLNLRVIGGSIDRMVALQKGIVNFTVVTEAGKTMAEKLGFPMIVDMAALGPVRSRGRLPFTR